MRYKPTEVSIARARRILVLTLPEITSHDEAMNNLFFVDPNSNENIRLLSIAAAIYILNEAAIIPERSEEPTPTPET